jgi:DnaJ-class molecular chaperone
MAQRLKKAFVIRGAKAGHSEQIRTRPSGSPMASSVSRSDDRLQSRAVGSCPQCGGSGLLRVNDQRYRTCLDCLGQGQAQPMTSDGLFFRMISAASVSGAR